MDKKKFKQLALLIAWGIILYVLLNHLGGLILLLRELLNLVLPLILGGVLAFVLNVPMHGLEEKLRKNRLPLTDYLDQMEQLQSMGDLSQIADMLPGGMAKGFDASQIDEKQMAHNKAIIQSMTPLERENPQILNASRKKRIAAGCGLEVVDVNRLLKSFEMLQQMTRAMTKGGGMRGMMGGFGGKVARGAMHGFGRKKRLK